jgi:pyruvate,water dikinase
MPNVFSWVLTFEKLFQETDFVKYMRDMLDILQKAYGCAVDVEFTCNFLEDQTYRINLVQCRPFQVQRGSGEVAIGSIPRTARIILETHGPIIGQSVVNAIDRLIFVVPSHYSSLPTADRYAIARLVGKLAQVDKSKKSIMLIGPGRWGTTTPSLGVPVSFTEINTVSVICELATMHEGLIPDVSLGTHFFNDLVEFNILYMAVYPDRKDGIFNEQFLHKAPNHLTELIPDAAQWVDVVKVIHIVDPTHSSETVLSVDSMNQKAVCYF